MKNLSLTIALFSLLYSIKSFSQPGALDNSFGLNGIVTYSLFLSQNIFDIAIQEDGKIIAAGSSGTYDFSDFGMVRFYENGSLDTTFGNNGFIVKNFFPQNYSSIQSLIIQPDGKILAMGNTNNHHSYYIAIVRFNEDGSPDLTFGNSGEMLINIGALQISGEAMVLQPTGKIIIGGSANNLNEFNPDFLLLRLNPDGTLDRRFGTNGSIITDFDERFESIKSLALQPDGKIVAGGKSSKDINSAFAILRYKANGKIDENFGQNGLILTEFNSINDWCESILIQPDGKIIAAGISSPSYAIAKYNVDGSPDISFGDNGRITASNLDEPFLISSALLQPDGKIIATGYAGLSNKDFLLRRFNTDGTPDSLFGKDGLVSTSFGASSVSLAGTVEIQKDGKIIAGGGSSFEFTPKYFALARYLSDMNVGVIDFAGQNNSIWVYPNPIKETATLEYTLTQAEEITIRLFDLNGKLIATILEKEKQNAGEYKQPLKFPGGLATGTYHLVLSSGKGKVSLQLAK